MEKLVVKQTKNIVYKLSLLYHYFISDLVNNNNNFFVLRKSNKYNMLSSSYV